MDPGSHCEFITRSLAEVDGGANPFECFEVIGRSLLTSIGIEGFGKRFSFVEIEFYYTSEHHPDPFTHCDDAQANFLRWYLHRTGSGLRSGSFKGLDLTIGGAGTYGGILVRSLELDDGTVVNGPSLCVDALIAAAGVDTVRDLHDLIGERAANGVETELRLVSTTPRDLEVHSSSRVGLSLKSASSDGSHRDFILRPYRFLTRPREVKKGRVNHVLALHHAGLTPDRIQRITGSPRKTVTEYVAWAQHGTGEPVDDATFSPSRARDLCNLYHVLQQ